MSLVVSDRSASSTAFTSFFASALFISERKLVQSALLLMISRSEEDSSYDFVKWLLVTVRFLLSRIRAQVREPVYCVSIFEGAKWPFTMFILPSLHPTKPPLAKLLLPVKLPSKRQSVMVSCPPPPYTATMPPLVASPLTVLLMVTDERQFSITTLPSVRAAMPPMNFWLLLMVPAVRRLRMAASLTYLKGASYWLLVLMLTVSVWPLPSKMPR